MEKIVNVEDESTSVTCVIGTDSFLFATMTVPTLSFATLVPKSIDTGSADANVP